MWQSTNRPLNLTAPFNIQLTGSSGTCPLWALQALRCVLPASGLRLVVHQDAASMSSTATPICPLLQATGSPPASVACTANPSLEPSSGPRALLLQLPKLPQLPRLPLQPQLLNRPRLPQLPRRPRRPQLQRQQPQAWRGPPGCLWLPRAPRRPSPFQQLLAEPHHRVPNSLPQR